MSEPLRRAGRGVVPGDDAVVLWSVAEGERGRRWRWMVNVYQGFLGTSGLVEVAPDGCLERIELTAYGGLLTFHPEGDRRSAHGNIVTDSRVYPISTTWDPDWAVGIVGDPFGSTVAGWAGSGLVVTRRGDWLVWREPGDHPDVSVLARDDRGIPLLDRADEWPLEEG